MQRYVVFSIQTYWLHFASWRFQQELALPGLEQSCMCDGSLEVIYGFGHMYTMPGQCEICVA